LIDHGYDIEPANGAPTLGPAPLRQRMLARGFAIAASSYSQRGWALFRTAADHRELLAAFAARFGMPGSIFASGGSMGGVVALQQAEQGDLGAPVTGVYAICAPLAVYGNRRSTSA
jgi:alpha-beta hydrolase superfamily lysophospholipase